MILSAQSIRHNNLVHPCLDAGRDEESSTSFGLSACGHDLRLAEDITLWPGMFCLASAVERFQMTNSVCGIVHDKSTWARRGIAVQNTVIEPGWRGFLTLEITNHGRDKIHLPSGCGVCQVVFHWLDAPTELPYDGKYQDQESGPQMAR